MLALQKGVRWWPASWDVRSHAWQMGGENWSLHGGMRCCLPLVVVTLAMQGLPEHSWKQRGEMQCINTAESEDTLNGKVVLLCLKNDDSMGEASNGEIRRVYYVLA